MNDVAGKFVAFCNDYKGDDVAPVFTNVPEIDEKIININDYPHLFVLSCLMDKQIKAERAWRIPYLVCENLCGGDFSFAPLANLSLADVEAFFKKNSLHRFNSDMAKVFVNAVERIKTVYVGDASKIWEGNNSSAEIIYRFLCFDGCGIKIASMATNLLYRIFGVKYSDYSALDISPDIHVRRVLNRLGLVENMDNVDLIIYKARDLNPSYPGLMDKCCWDVGRNYCHATNPNCGECMLTSFCPKRNI